MYSIHRCCNPQIVVDPPPPPPCSECLAFSNPVIPMLDSVGPCMEAGSVIITSSANCSSFTLEIISHDDAFSSVTVVGNQVFFTTVPGKAVPGQSYIIRGRGRCTAGLGAGSSAQWIAQITILDRCYQQTCVGCDPCTGLCPPPEVRVFNTAEVVLIP